MEVPSIAIIGDFDKNMYTHVALNQCIQHCEPHIAPTNFKWLATNELSTSDRNLYQGFLIAPGSPYRDDSAVYDLIQWTRENNGLMFGMCGGFQYMIVEYARNVLELVDGDHEESNPGAADLIVSKMHCSLKGLKEEITITDTNSWLCTVLKTKHFIGEYNCGYGVNLKYGSILNKHPFVFTAFSTATQHSDSNRGRVQYIR